ncbi:hypothetical protein [Methylobacillus flagellatus]|uniref:hypothetical protein n=1 Tax=Methylobacillus flagellatus TaxID=405 RepID=UPI0010F9F5FA|nr:hypothetical protein [Methylobacillus flagellatus]
MMGRFREFDDLTPPEPAATKADMRASMPAAAAMVDELRLVFGADLKVLRVEEAGAVVVTKAYRPDTSYRACLTASDYLELGEIAQRNADDLEAKAAGNGKK